jgi:acyl dehydratase
MPIDAQRLLDYKVEDVRQRYSADDSAFYALSVAMGRDPLNERRLPFVDPAKGDAQLVLPSMALVIGYPGFWMVRPDTTIDPARILHGSQAVQWHRMLPPSGEVVGRTRIVRLVDRGPGKHAMVVSERKIVDAATEEPYATLTQVHVLLGQGGFGGDPQPLPSPHAIPLGEPHWTIDVPTTRDQALLYRLNGDLFALHSDPQMARKAGFQRPILHGMCVAGVVTQVLMGVCVDDDPARLRGIDLRFSSPVYPGDTIRVEAWQDGSFQARCVERGELVLSNGLLSLSQA